MSEADLLRQAQQGDRAAFRALHDSLEPAIRRFVERLIGRGVEAEDAVQDTMIALYRNMHRIEPVENVRPYVYKIARHRCYDALRKQGRYEKLPLDEDAVRVRVSFEYGPRLGPEDLTHWMLLTLEVRAAIDQLPEAQRQALILYAEEGLSYREVAEVVGVSLGTVKSRIYHAKKTLRRLLHPETLQAISGSFNID